MEKIDKKELVIFDVETTGLSAAGGDRIVEVAALKVNGREAAGRFHTLVDSGREVSYGAFRVNGITQEMLSGAPYPAEVFPRLMEFIGDAHIIGHNIKFDIGFLLNELSLIDFPLKKKLVTIDTIRMARTLLPGMVRYSLQHVARHLGIDQPQEHRAMSDVEMTFEVYCRLLDISDKKENNDVYSVHLDDV